MRHVLPTLLIALVTTAGFSAAASNARAAELLVEAESFADHGGWVLDTQFIDEMGSPYLMAHGLGTPVKDATTTIKLPAAGAYKVWVRTKDWVAPWDAPGAPGRFQLLIDGKPLKETFGTKGAQWGWHDGGTVEFKSTTAKLALKDLTGFNGRIDAIYFTTDAATTPPDSSQPMDPWRRKLLGQDERGADAAGAPFDLVVVGGGYSGMGAAISGARMGLKVALIQDRPVLGGNGSSEIRVWAQGLIRRGRYPHIGEIIEEFADKAKMSPGTYEEFEDARKEALVRAEKNISLFLNHRAYGVEVSADGKSIVAVKAFDTRTNQIRRFPGRFTCDATGHGWVGYWAGADYDMTDKGRMGMSNMWRWTDTGQPQTFPQTPWALPLTMEDFPYPQKFHAQWFWESGFDKDPLYGAELIRDHNLRAAFGAFNAMKNGDGKAEHVNAKLEWLAYIGGPRESRRLLGDLILTQDDIVEKRDFPDGCVPSTWSIDLHYPKEQYLDKFRDNPFISIAVHDRRVDRQYGYPIPYRCFYSRNITNLFMAGRNISVTHEALGTTRVMKTCGMMGEVVGKAASICVQKNATPREIYTTYLPDLVKLLELPGRARRDTVNDPIRIEGEPPPPLVEAVESINIKKLKGIVVDEKQAKKTGKWTEGHGLKPYVGDSYAYARGAGVTATFEFTVPATGRYEVRYASGYHENRASNVAVAIHSADGVKTATLNQKVKAPIDDVFTPLGVFTFEAGKPAKIVVDASKANGNVQIDAVQILPVE